MKTTPKQITALNLSPKEAKIMKSILSAQLVVAQGKVKNLKAMYRRHAAVGVYNIEAMEAHIANFVAAVKDAKATIANEASSNDELAAAYVSLVGLCNVKVRVQQPKLTKAQKEYKAIEAYIRRNEKAMRAENESMYESACDVLFGARN